MKIKEKINDKGCIDTLVKSKYILKPIKTQNKLLNHKNYIYIYMCTRIELNT